MSVDNVAVTAGSGTTIATDNIAGVNYQRVKVVWGTDGVATDADTANGAPLPAQIRSSGGTELATSSNPLRIDPTGTTAQPITDNGGSLTVDGTVATNADGTTGSAVPAKGLLVQGSDGTNARNISTTTGGVVKVDISATAANATAVKVDNSAVTQPISAVSLPLPTSAATDASVTAVQGTTGSAAPAKGLLVQGSDGTNARNVSTTTAGILKVDISATTANTTAVKVDGSAVTQPVSISGNQAVNVAQINGVTPSMGNGVSGTGVQRVAVASDNTPFQISASNETGSIYNGTTALTPLFSTIVASASGATTIVAAVTSKKIRVVAMQLVANAAVNVKWQSHVTPTDKTGLAYLAANGGYVLPYNPVGWFETVAGEALDINLSGAVAVGGSLTYITV